MTSFQHSLDVAEIAAQCWLKNAIKEFLTHVKRDLKAITGQNLKTV